MISTLKILTSKLLSSAAMGTASTQIAVVVTAQIVTSTVQTNTVGEKIVSNEEIIQEDIARTEDTKKVVNENFIKKTDDSYEISNHKVEKSQLQRPIEQIALSAFHLDKTPAPIEYKLEENPYLAKQSTPTQIISKAITHLNTNLKNKISDFKGATKKIPPIFAKLNLSQSNSNRSPATTANSPAVANVPVTPVVPVMPVKALMAQIESVAKIDIAPVMQITSSQTEGQSNEVAPTPTPTPSSTASPTPAPTPFPTSSDTIPDPTVDSTVDSSTDPASDLSDRTIESTAPIDQLEMATSKTPIYKANYSKLGSNYNRSLTVDSVPNINHRLYILAVNHTTSSVSVSSISKLGSRSWTKLYVQCSRRSSNILEIWYLIGDGTSSANSITVNFSNSARESIAIISSYDQVDTTHPIQLLGHANNNGFGSNASCGGERIKTSQINYNVTSQGHDSLLFIANSFGVQSSTSQIQEWEERLQIDESYRNGLNLQVGTKPKEIPSESIINAILSSPAYFSSIVLEINSSE